MGWVIVSTSLRRGGKAIERTVWSSTVVTLPPVLNDDVFLHGREFFAVQAFVMELAVETFDVTILPRAFRLDVRRAYIDRFK